MKIFNKYKFSNKSQSLGGTISTLMGIGSLTAIAYSITLSFKAEGNAGLEAGSFGLLALLLSVIGTVIGLLGFKEQDKFYILSKVGSLLCGIVTVFLIAVFLMGI